MKYVLLVIFLIIFPLAVIGLELQGIQSEIGMTWLGNSNQSYGSIPSPIIPRIGGGLTLKLNTNFSYLPRVGIYRQEYRLTETGIAVPTGMEFTDAAVIWNIVIEHPVIYWFSSNSSVRIGAGFSPTIFFRFAGKRYGEAQAGSLVAFFYRKLRFLCPETSFIFQWDLSKKTSAAINLSTVWPLYSLWDSIKNPIWDGMMIDLSLLVSFSF
jgi:hypothetical protein